MLLSGCDIGSGTKVPITDSRNCFPKDAQHWIAKSKEAGQLHSVAVPTAARKATVYVDHSGSMVGYIAGGTNLERPLQDLIATIPSSLKTVGIDTALRSFGTKVSDELPDAGKQLLRAEAYVCKAADRAACDNSESRLDTVLGQVASQNDDLAIIVSDLWFSNSDIQSTGIAALQPMLTDLLFKDKVIAIYGIDAPFAGKIYDLPQAGNGSISVPYQGRHPLYVMVVGSKRAVIDFDSALASSGSNSLAEGAKSGRIMRSVFTVDPGPLEYNQKQPLIGGSKQTRLHQENFEIPTGVSIQRFVMTAGLPEKSGKVPPASPQWVGPDPSGFLANAVWIGPLATQTRVWKQTSKACSATSWIEQKSDQTSQIGWLADSGNGQMTFQLDPNKFAATLLTEGVYMIVGETKRLSVTQPNPATQWMRGAWNLNPAQAEAAARSTPPTFPTLNLSEFGRIMEGALAAAAERKNQPLVGFAVLVKVDN